MLVPDELQCLSTVGPVDNGFCGAGWVYGYIWGAAGRMVVALRWTLVPLPRLLGPPGMELRKHWVWEEDLLSAEGVIVPGWMEGDKGVVSISGVVARPIRCVARPIR